MNKTIKYLICLIAFIIFIHGFFIDTARSQDESFRQQMNFGFNVSPVIPVKWLMNKDIIETNDSATYSLSQKTSYLLGMQVRYDYMKHYSFETGINFIRRNYDATLLTESLDTTSRLKFIGYEVPVMGYLFVRLTKHIYMDNAYGFCFNVNPSDIAIKHYYVQRWWWFHVSFVTNVGWEIRTSRAGYYYIGLLYQYHIKDMLKVGYYEGSSIGQPDIRLDVSGNYLAVNIKYYFPQNKK